MAPVDVEDEIKTEDTSVWSLLIMFIIWLVYSPVSKGKNKVTDKEDKPVYMEDFPEAYVLHI
jgi:hypothetical protein